MLELRSMKSASHSTRAEPSQNIKKFLLLFIENLSTIEHYVISAIFALAALSLNIVNVTIKKKTENLPWKHKKLPNDNRVTRAYDSLQYFNESCLRCNYLRNFQPKTVEENLLKLLCFDFWSWNFIVYSKFVIKNDPSRASDFAIKKPRRRVTCWT